MFQIGGIAKICSFAESAGQRMQFNKFVMSLAMFGGLLMPTIGQANHFGMSSEPKQSFVKYYVIGGAGYSDFDLDDDVTGRFINTGGPVTIPVNFDLGTSKSARLAFGRFNNGTGIELGYNKLGDRGGSSISSVSLGLFKLFPIKKTMFDLMVRGDLHWVRTKYDTQSVRGAFGKAVVTESPGISLGFGSRYIVSRNFFIQGQYDLIYTMDDVDMRSAVDPNAQVEVEVKNLIQHASILAGYNF